MLDEVGHICFIKLHRRLDLHDIVISPLCADDDFVLVHGLFDGNSGFLVWFSRISTLDELNTKEEADTPEVYNLLVRKQDNPFTFSFGISCIEYEIFGKITKFPVFTFSRNEVVLYIIFNTGTYDSLGTVT